jgi:hypothetical protein
MKPPPEATPLTVAVRQWHEPAAVEDGEAQGPGPRARTDPAAMWPDGVLAFDTETTVDRAQRLTFGWYRYARWQRNGTLATVAEGILYADDLPERDPAGFATLQNYVSAHSADTAAEQGRAVQLLNRRAFLNDVLWPAIQADALILGFNLPFDLSRLAVGWGETRRRRKRGNGGMPSPDVFTRGFSLTLWEYQDKQTGAWREHSYRPRVKIKHVDNKRAFIGLGPVRKRDRRDPHHGGRFLDLKTLAFALTNRGHSLKSACEAFGVEEGKAATEQHGVITPAYIAYARQDVRAYLRLLERLRTEFDHHPIDLLPDRAQSPASIAKAYQRAMGISPLLERQPTISRTVLGQTMSAYYGGRTECRIRRVPVPVVYVDFLAMYMTVQGLLDGWRFVTAERIEAVDAMAEVQAMLDGVTIGDGFDPAMWPQLTFFAQIVPEGDVLPVRAAYVGPGCTIGVNPLEADRPLWYPGPDLVTSTLLTGKPPRVIQAFRLVPHGTLSTLQPTSLGGVLPIDPRSDDFFRFVIEERKRVKQAKRQGEPVPEHLDPFLKVLANSGGYGIFAELNRQELPADERVAITVYGASDAPFSADTNAPEMPGRTCYPPLAALITSAARLMLALLEREVTDRGGSYAFCDTDSMAIVASEHGELVPCSGGLERLPDGMPAVRALSWTEVEAMVARFAALNPYDRAVVPGSILEVEEVNHDADSRARRQLWCYAISAKRYAMFTRDGDGVPQIVDEGYSEHGLGHLLNPDDPESDNREWIRTIWAGLVSEALGQPFASPAWLSRPAMSRITASSPQVLRPLDQRQRPYAEAVKPFNFLVSPHVAPLGHPVGVDPQHFHLIAPYTRDARQWTKLRWTDVYSGEAFRITTGSPAVGDATARVQSYGNVIARYRTHPEAKSLGPDGAPCGRRMVGLLQRRRVVLGELVHIGKETNRLEEVEQGLVHDWPEVQLVFREPRGDSWATEVLPVLRSIPRMELARATGASKRTLRDILAERRQPHPTLRRTLLHYAEMQLGTGRRMKEIRANACGSCGTPIHSSQTRYCSSACRQRAYRQRYQPMMN